MIKRNKLLELNYPQDSMKALFLVISIMLIATIVKAHCKYIDTELNWTYYFTAQDEISFAEVTPNCQVDTTTPIVTFAQCSVVANQLLACSFQKLMNDVVNNKILTQEAETKSEILRDGIDEWHRKCKSRVLNLKYSKSSI